MDCICVYCKKKVSDPDPDRALRKMRGHLRHCPVRVNGINYKIGVKTFNVKPRSIMCVQRLNKVVNDIAPLPHEIKDAIFLGVLVGEKANKKIKDFSY